jgi:hypothetical protein
MSVRVIDISGDPVKNREVRLFISDSILMSIKQLPQPNMTAITNNLGDCNFSYDLLADDIASDYAHFLVKEDSNYIAVNAISHAIHGALSSEKSPIKLSGTIRMDSFVTFKVQVKANKSNVTEIALDLNTKHVQLANNPIMEPVFNKTFISILNRRLPSTLDTTITTKVWLRIPMAMNNSIKLSDGSQLFGNHIIDSDDVRKAVFINEISKHILI